MRARAKLPESLLWAAASLCVVLAVVLGLMHGNLDSVRVADVVRPLAVLGTAAVALTLALMALWPTAGRLVPAALYAFFSFHDLQGLFAAIGSEELLAGLVVVSCPLAFHVVLRRVDATRAAVYTLTAGAAVVVSVLVRTAPTAFYAPPPAVDEDFQRQTLAAVARHGGGAAELPDIIYVVPDRYPSGPTLAGEFNFDNRAFYAALRRRGFLVSENARANYPKTFLSLASTLNGGYLGNFTAAYGPDTPDKRPIFEVMEDNIVQDRLRRLGYRFHNYGNWWEPTRVNRFAEVNDSGYPPDSLHDLSEFERALFLKTPVRRLVRSMAGTDGKMECRRIRRKFQRLAEVGNEDRPVFVFAHTLVPHSPIVMDAEGRCLPRYVIYARDRTASWPQFKAAYIEYLKYFNRTILRVIDRQIARRGRNGRQLLFVIQSDEGPFPKSLREAMKDYDLTTLTPRQIVMKTGIINAIRLPNGPVGAGQPPLTPVNNWRLIFNALTGSKMKMLPDNVFIFPTEGSLYRFCDVTALATGEETPVKTCAN